jgi:hypothetical protein
MLLAPLIWKTWDIPVGYYRFQKLCEAEAGFTVYVPNPPPAKLVRLGEAEAKRMPNSPPAKVVRVDMLSYFAEDLLKRSPSIQGVEARDKEFDYLSKPKAFALYERAEDGNITSRLIDKVGKRSGKGATVVLESAPSKADYIFTKTRDYYPGDRISRERLELRSKDGTLIGFASSLDYRWSHPPNTLFNFSIHTSRCGPQRAALYDEYIKLLDLIAPVTK